ncbi:MAG: SNF2-related protein [Actinomycetota bacterium]|nr:SNF2-related protein [Actinomycetota bacterium]
MKRNTQDDRPTRQTVRMAAGSKIYGRGRDYYADGMVISWTEESPGSVVGTVRGSGNKRYKTEVVFEDGYFESYCSCPYDWSDVCKHGVALALAYLDRDKLDRDASASEEARDARGDTGASRPAAQGKNSDPLAWQRALDGLVGRPDSAHTQSPPHYRAIYRLDISYGEQLNVAFFRARIGKRGKGAEDRFYFESRSPNNFLRERDIIILRLLGNPYIYQPSYVAPDVVDPLLRLLAGEDYVFLGAGDERPQISFAPISAQLVLTAKGDDYELGVSLDSEKLAGREDGLYILGENKPWVTDGVSFHPLDTALSGSTIRNFLKNPHVIPAEQIGVFMARYYDALAGKSALEVRGDGDGTLDVRDDITPRPVLCLEDSGKSLGIALFFAYGDGPPQVKSDSAVKIVKAAADEASCWARRRFDLEAQALLELENNGVKLNDEGEGRLYADDALNFLQYTAGELRERGFDVAGEVTTLRINSAKAEVRAKIRSGIDWFDLNLEAGYGDSLVDISTMLAAYRSGRTYVQLDDGSWGRLPLEWLDRASIPMDELVDLEGVKEDGGNKNGSVKIRPHHIPLAEDILSGIDVYSSPSFSGLREKLGSFNGVETVNAPRGLRAELRDYQRKGLDWLNFLSEFSFNGILADDMGLGKTVQALAHLLRQKEAAPASKPSLIIAPTSVAYNWEEEGRRFTPALNTLLLTGPDRHQRFTDIDGADIVITTYALLRRDFDELSRRAYHAIILDEAQSIKNPGAQTTKLCKSLSAHHRLALTGTPLENNLTELWSIFDFLAPGLLGSHKSFQTRYEKPIAKLGDGAALERLKRRLRPFILRRVKQDVARELPPKTEIIVHCEMTSPQRALYRQVLNTYRAKVFESIESKGIERSQITILDALLKLRQVCNHPQLVKVASNKVKTSGKMELFQEMIEQLVSEGHRALVFSQFTQMLAILREWLDQKGIPYCYLDGRTRDRPGVIGKFNENGAPLFLISLKAGGVGLNLTAADYVIHVDPWWNPAVENQATDRAYRIGQDKHVFVYKMITRDSIEEKILKLQARKKELFDSILSGGGPGVSLSREDLEDLFRDAGV